MNWPQFFTIVVLLLVAIAAIPWSVEHAVSKRWGEIKMMFDRALFHGDSLDTLKDQMRRDSEATKASAGEALRQAQGAVEAVALLHRDVKALQEHPILRRPGGTL